MVRQAFIFLTRSDRYACLSLDEQLTPSEEADFVAVWVEDNCVALAPECVPGASFTLETFRYNSLVGGIYFGGSVALETKSHSLAGWLDPGWIDLFHHAQSIKGEPEAVGQRDFDVIFAVRKVRKLNSEHAIEPDRVVDVRGNDADVIKFQGHGE